MAGGAANVGDHLNASDYSPPSRWKATLALVLALVLPPGASATAQGAGDSQIKLDPQYHAPGCEPIPSIPTLGRWFARKVLAYEELAATSADCGLVGSAKVPSGADKVVLDSRARAAANGWTYIVWSEQTDAANLAQQVIRRLNLTQLVLVKPDEGHSVPSFGHGFLLVQLDGDEAKPALVWTAGLVKSLDATLSINQPEGIKLRVESVDLDDQRCVSEKVLRKDRADLPEPETLPCQ